MPKPVSPESKFANFEAVAESELEAINQRRKVVGLPDSPEEVKKTLSGLAFSGGGIRSASFCLGFLQALARTPKSGTQNSEVELPKNGTDTLATFDYLSTVSGGGYTGAMLSSRAYFHSSAQNKTGDQPQVDKPLVKRQHVLKDLADRTADKQGNPPKWQNVLHHGLSAGKMLPFLTQQIASTFAANLVLFSGLALICTILSLIWRELDHPPIHTFFSWASNNKVIEFNRPFLIPAALLTTYLVIFFKIRKSGFWPAMLGIVLITSIFFAKLGLPYLIVSVAILNLQTITNSLCLRVVMPILRSNGNASSVKSRLEKIPKPEYLKVVAHLIIPGAYAAIFFTLLTTVSEYHHLFCSTLLFFILSICVIYVAPKSGTLDNRLVGRITLIATGLGTLTGFAVWFSTPNMNTGNIGGLIALNSTPNNYLNLIFGSIAALLLPFLRMDSIIRSGMQAKSSSQRWMFNIFSSALLLGVPFVLVSWIAGHNVSGFAKVQDRELAPGDVSFEYVLQQINLNTSKSKSGNSAEQQPSTSQKYNVQSTLDWTLSLINTIPQPSSFAKSNKKYNDLLAQKIADEEIIDKKFDPKQSHTDIELLEHKNNLKKLIDDFSNSSGILLESTEPSNVDARIADEFGIAIPKDLNNWKNTYSHYRNENRLMIAFSKYVRSPEFVLKIINDKILLDGLIAKANELSSRKGDDPSTVAWRNHGSLLKESLLGLQQRLYNYEIVTDENQDLTTAKNQLPNKDNFSPEFNSSLETLGLLAFIAIYSDHSNTRPFGFVSRPTVIGRDQLVRILLAFVLLILFISSSFLIDLNWISPLGYYRSQLQDAYLFDQSELNKEKTLQEIESVDPPLELLDNTKIGLPYQIFGCAVDVAEVKNDPSRSMEHFLLSSRYIGSQKLGDSLGNNGYCKTTNYQTRDYHARPMSDWNTALREYHSNRSLKLSDVMALSGAAVTPQRFDNWLMRAVLTITNLRLGQWLPHPNREERIPATAKNVVFDLPMFTTSMADNRLVYVADGGFFDNLGLEALLDRKCRLIVVVDASWDHEFLFADLSKALQKAELRGIRISSDNSDNEPLDIKKLLPRDNQSKDPPESAPVSTGSDFLGGLFSSTASNGAKFASRLSETNFIVGKITYPDGSVGKLIYAKPTLKGDEPAEVLAFRKAQPVFPYHSTAEQLFDWSTMNAYRRLGEHVGQAVAAELNKPTTEDIPKLIKQLEQRSLQDWNDLNKLIDELKERPPAQVDDKKLTMLIKEFDRIDSRIAEWFNGDQDSSIDAPPPPAPAKIPKNPPQKPKGQGAKKK